MLSDLLVFTVFCCDFVLKAQMILFIYCYSQTATMYLNLMFIHHMIAAVIMFFAITF